MGKWQKVTLHILAYPDMACAVPQSSSSERRAPDAPSKRQHQPDLQLGTNAGHQENSGRLAPVRRTNNSVLDVALE